MCTYERDSAASQFDRITLYHEVSNKTNSITSLGIYSLDQESLYINGKVLISMWLWGSPITDCPSLSWKAQSCLVCRWNSLCSCVLRLGDLILVLTSIIHLHMNISPGFCPTNISRAAHRIFSLPCSTEAVGCLVDSHPQGLVLRIHSQVIPLIISSSIVVLHNVSLTFPLQITMNHLRDQVSVLPDSFQGKLSKEIRN